MSERFAFGRSARGADASSSNGGMGEIDEPPPDGGGSSNLVFKTVGGPSKDPSTANELDDGNDDGDHQQEVDETSRDMEDEAAEDPQNHQNYCERPKHASSPDPATLIDR